jgi:hypothetical protein
MPVDTETERMEPDKRAEGALEVRKQGELVVEAEARECMRRMNGLGRRGYPMKGKRNHRAVSLSGEHRGCARESP